MKTEFFSEKAGYTTTYTVVDVDTGEIVFQRIEDDPKAALDNGCDVIRGSFLLYKEDFDNGVSCWTIDGGKHFNKRFWKKKAQKNSSWGRDRTYIRLDPKNFEGLADNEVIALIRLTPHLMSDGSLRTKNRKRCLTKQEVQAIFPGSKNKQYGIWHSLEDKEILRVDDKVVFLNKRYLSRGKG